MKGVKTLLMFGLFSWGGMSLVHSQQLQEQIILYDDFISRNQWTSDITLTYPWSSNGAVVSGFELGVTSDLNGLTKQSVRITPEALSKPGYKPGTMLAGLAFDYRFQSPVDRTQTTLKIEFDALWEAINNSGWGESGRLVLTLLHDYPKDSIAYNTIFSVEKEAAFGRPAYNLRIRNHERTGPYYSGSFMMYGGGMDEEGEIEKYQGEYWLPGFSSEPGGTSPGLLPAYPLSPTMKNEQMTTVAIPFWKHYTWLIMPERMEFYLRNSDQPETANQLVFFMQIPKTTKTEEQIIQEINDAHQTNITSLPVLYNWFSTIEALRVYFRGEQQTNLANLVVKTINSTLPTQITESEVNHIKVWPNPSDGNFKIQTELADQFQTITITDMSGQKIYQNDIEPDERLINIQLSGSQSGIYLVRLEGITQTKTVKIVIQ
jgi:hypothetical protein